MSSAAELVLRIIEESAGEGIEETRKKLQGLKGDAESAGTAGKGLSSALSSIGNIAAGVVIGGGIAAIPGILKSATEAAAADEASLTRLRQAVDNTGSSYASYAVSMDAAVHEAAQLGFAHEETRNAVALLAAQTGSAAEALSRLSIAQDLARGTGMDLETAARLVGKVSEENTNVLGRYGISISKTATEQEALATITEKFGGQAAAFGGSAAGSFARFSIAVNELSAALGRSLIPALTLLAEAATPVVNFIGMMTEGFALSVGAITNWVGISHDAASAAGEEAQANEGLSDSLAHATAATNVLGMETKILNDSADAATGRLQAYALWLDTLRQAADAAGQSLAELASAQGLDTSPGAFTGLSGGAPARASGGPVSSGAPYWVGENQRRELFVPSSSGYIVPEDQLGGIVGSSSSGSSGPVTIVLAIEGLRNYIVSTTREALLSGGFRGQLVVA